MRKKLIASLSILVVFAFAIAAFAYTQNTAPVALASCCKSKDSCPMKSKGHDASSEHVKKDCCKHEEGKACDCCGDSCPMKKKDGATAASASTEGKDCCDNCDCCNGKKGTSA